MLDRAQADRLIQLWAHRGDFSTEAEWVELYQQIKAVLMRCRAPQLANLPESREVYVQDYFTHKVFETAGRNTTQLFAPGALCGFFSNYLIDRLRDLNPEAITSLGNEEEGESPLIERLAVTDDATEDLDPANDAMEYGISLEQARESARILLNSLPAWQLIVLARKICADLDESTPIYKLAEQLGAQSAAYHLAKLGVTKRHGGSGNSDFRTTILGKWIESFGVELTPENSGCIQWLVAQLCHEAQNMDTEESAP